MSSEESPRAGRPLRIAVVLWAAEVGGAETVKAALVQRLRQAGVDASIVVVTGDGPLVSRLARDGIPFTVVGLARGRDALLHPRRLASVLTEVAPDGAVLVDGGHLAAALRAGGYGGSLVGAEHGKVLSVPSLPRLARAKDRLERLVSSPLREADVAVSEFVTAELRRRPHARRLLRIHNGLDLGLFSPAATPLSGRVRVGCAARLVPGKGVGTLLRAAVVLGEAVETIAIAGDGPERAQLEQDAQDLGVGGTVAFEGRVDAMPAFWRGCSLAVVPSESAESFSMTTLEAMASGIPVVASAVGGIPEVLVDGVTGTLVPPADPEALALAIGRYAADPVLRQEHGRAGLERARRCFSIDTTAARYLELFEVKG